MKTKYILLEFKAEYYCKGYEWSTFTRLVKASSFEEACKKVLWLKTSEWELGTPKNFKNLTVL